MSRGYAGRRRLAWIGAGALIVLHVLSPDHEGVIGGVLPWDLAFHIAWMVAAAILIELIARFAWRDVDGAHDG